MSPARLFPALSAAFALGAAALYFHWDDAVGAAAVDPAPPQDTLTPRSNERTVPPTELAREVAERPRGPAALVAGSTGEAASMQRLRALRTTAPLEALALAGELEARFPNSPDAAERSYLTVRSLVELRRFHEARDRAQALVARFPGDAYALDVRRHLLVNPLDFPSREEQQRAPPEAPRD